MPIRDWTKNIPSTRQKTATNSADEPAPEEDAGEEEQEAGHRGAGEDARQPPGELVLADIDAGGLAGPVEDEDLLAIVRRVRPGDVDGPRGRLERQPGIGEDGIGVVECGSMT